MDRASQYYKQVQLLMRVLPIVSQESCFALKGGTAINLFVRDLPRLSVDIDLVYLPTKGRDEALAEIAKALDAIAENLASSFSQARLIKAYKAKHDALRLTVCLGGVRVKVELSPVLRGTLHQPQMMQVSPAVEDEFGYVNMLVVAMSDLYAGKICAALDRQHPRDLFDVKWLLENHGLPDEIRKTFLVYLASHNRPMAELLRPQFKDISAIYAGEFASMAQTSVPLEELLRVRERLIAVIHEGLTNDEKAFLVSFKSRSPDWSLLGLSGVSKLPAIQWKQLNLAKMPPGKHSHALEKLKEVLRM